MKHVLLTDLGGVDSIRVYSREPLFMVTGNREDMDLIAQMDESNSPGVYILMGIGQIYVGQSASSMLNRLRSHDKDKSWWTSVVFFGRDDGKLDKSQTEYIERSLIDIFYSKGLVMVNNTVGNAGYIDKRLKLQADGLMSLFFDTVYHYTNILSAKPSDLIPARKGSVLKIVSSDGLEFNERSWFQSLRAYVEHYLQEASGFGVRLYSSISDDEPSENSPLGRFFGEVPPNCIELFEGVGLYRLNKIQGVLFLNECSSIMGLDVDHSWI